VLVSSAIAVILSIEFGSVLLRGRGGPHGHCGSGTLRVLTSLVALCHPADVCRG
jgi:hypothetical protein